MRLYKLNNKVLRLQGNAQKLLMGLSSNALDKPYNAFLNLHGRIVTTFYQEKISDEEFLIAVPPTALERALTHVERYAKLNGTKVLLTSLNAYMDFDTAQIIFKEEEMPSDISFDEFTLFRLEKFIPLLGVDFQADEFILNINQETFVSFTKGCFLGQEPVAKVHNRSKPSRQLKVCFEDEIPLEDRERMTSKAKERESGRIKGFIFVKNS